VCWFQDDFKNFGDKESALKIASELAETVNKTGTQSFVAGIEDPRIKKFSDAVATYRRTIDEAFELTTSVSTLANTSWR
jgi:hypothetical protein